MDRDAAMNTPLQIKPTSMATTTSRAVSGVPGSNPSQKPLSCTSCRQRKVKCNKTYPCSPCTKSGIECVFPQRLRVPRGKQRASKARDSELLERIGRLETLVSKADAVKALFKAQSRGNAQSLEGLKGLDDEASSPEPPDSMNKSSSSRKRSQPDGELTEGFAAFIREQEGGNRYIGKDFWNSLEDEVEGLRAVLEQQGEVDEHVEHDDATSTPAKSVESPNFVFSIGPSRSSRVPIKQPDHTQRSKLMHIYMRNVHPCCPVLHEPIIREHLLETTEMLDESQEHFKFPSLDALSFGICFAAVSSINAEECQAVLGEEREVLLARYKTATEQALGAADFLNSMEMVTLTTFVVYLVAARASNSTRSVWALVGLAVRIAHSLNLHRDGDGTQFGTFEAELRRRLWWQLMILDMRASEDRGSEPVIADNSFNTAMPHNLNDEDFGRHSQGTLPDKRCSTLMSYFMMSADVSMTIRKLNFVPLFDSVPRLTITQKEQSVRECISRLETHYTGGINTGGPSPELSSILGRILSLRLWSVLQYPFQRQRSEANVSWPEGVALQTAVNMLELVEKSIAHPDGGRFVWYWNTWVPWHPVAMALAELCKTPHGALADRAWPIVEKGYRLCSLRVADSSVGMLWKPVKKLYQKAQELRSSTTKSIGLRGPGALSAKNSPRGISEAYKPVLPMSIESLCDIPGNSAVQNSIPPMMSADAQIYARQYPPSYTSAPPDTNILANYSPILNNTTSDDVAGYLAPVGLDWLPHGVNMALGDDYIGQVNWDVWHDFMFDQSDMTQSASTFYGTTMDMGDTNGQVVNGGNGFGAWNL